MVERTEQHKSIMMYSYKMFNETIEKLAPELKAKSYKNIYAIPRGGLIFGTYLSHILKIPMTHNIDDGTLIVDDICDTGETLKSFRNDKVCLVAKDLGIKRTKNLTYDIGVEDDVWIKFFWEVE